MNNDQGRKPPAYLVYAAARMADINHRQLTLAGRGLRSSLEDECWCNCRMPADPEKLAKVLGYQADEIRRTLPEVMPFFQIEDGFLVSPELENYRTHLLRIRTAQSEGGKRGSGVLHKKRGRSITRTRQGSEGDSVSDLEVTQRVTHDSLIQPNPIQSKSTPAFKDEVITTTVDKAWVSDFEEAEKDHSSSAAAYRARRA